jgi:hypothetical protein
MSDTNYEFEEEQEQQGKDPVRAHMRKLEAENKALREQAALAATAQRELTFVKAGINPDDPRAKYFVKGYDGELSVDAIRSAAAEAAILSPVVQPSHAEPLQDEKSAWNRMGQLARSAEVSDAPVDWEKRIRSAKSPDEVMQLIAQARAEAESI